MDARPAVKVVPPTFDGTGDVKLFIRHFTDVATASKWQDEIALLQLRNSLRDKAVDCGRAADFPAVVVVEVWNNSQRGSDTVG